MSIFEFQKQMRGIFQIFYFFSNFLQLTATSTLKIDSDDYSGKTCFKVFELKKKQNWPKMRVFKFYEKLTLITSLIFCFRLQ